MMNLIPRRRDANLFSLMDDMERNFFNNAISDSSRFRCDIADKGDHYELDAELPGFKKEDINISVDGATLTISASNKVENDDKDDVTREFTKGATRGLQEGWMEGNYLRLMPGLSLEDRTNW